MRFSTSFSCMLLLLLLGAATADETVPRRPHREVWAWAGGKPELIPAQAAQLLNSSYSNLIDGIQLAAGARINGSGLFLDEDSWKASAPIVKAALQTNTKIHLWVWGSFPEAGTDPTPFIQDAIALHRRLNGIIDGFSFDDERDCAPRGNVSSFRDWITFQNQLTTALHQNGITVSSAVQAMFGIQPEGNKTTACQQRPSAYPIQTQVIDLVQNAVLDKWLVMDTYYFSTARFLSALDWYTTYFPAKQLGIGIQNRTLFSEDELVGRFHALHNSKMNHINVFMMPIDDKFLPFLQRWKTHCLGCGSQSALGCFDMSIECNGKVNDINIKN